MQVGCVSRVDKNRGLVGNTPPTPYIQPPPSPTCTNTPPYRTVPYLSDGGCRVGQIQMDGGIVAAPVAEHVLEREVADQDI